MATAVATVYGCHWLVLKRTVPVCKERNRYRFTEHRYGREAGRAAPPSPHHPHTVRPGPPRVPYPEQDPAAAPSPSAQSGLAHREYRIRRKTLLLRAQLAELRGDRSVAFPGPEGPGDM